jgi:hypothetical protein
MGLNIDGVAFGPIGTRRAAVLLPFENGASALRMRAPTDSSGIHRVPPAFAQATGLDAGTRLRGSTWTGERYAMPQYRLTGSEGNLG